MKYTVEVKQVLTGYVEVEADNAEQAIEKVSYDLEQCGNELPEMDDYDDLKFNIVE